MRNMRKQPRLPPGERGIRFSLYLLSRYDRKVAMMKRENLDTIPLNYNEQIGIKGIISDLVEKYSFIKQIILYGSRARGGFLEGSDIDLLFVTETEITRSLKTEISDTIYDHELANDIVVSAVFISESDFRNKISPFLMSIRKEGIIIWSKE